MVGMKTWESLNHCGTQTLGEKKGALRRPLWEPWGRKAGSGIRLVAPSGELHPCVQPALPSKAQPGTGQPDVSTRPGAHASPLSTSGLRNLRGLGEPPRPMSLPASSGARLLGSRPASRLAEPGRVGRRRRSPARNPQLHLLALGSTDQRPPGRTMGSDEP